MKNSFTSNLNLLGLGVRTKIIKNYELFTLQQVDRYCRHFTVLIRFPVRVEVLMRSNALLNNCGNVFP